LFAVFSGHETASFGFGTHLFVKTPRPGDSEVAFCGLRVKLHLLTTV